jgi:S-adenosylmethionine-diacylglycerol 3-amino-3-carboxypropyl transferase
LTDVPRLDRFDVVSLSNLLDGASDADAARWAAALRALAPGSAIILRQLNSTRDLRPLFEPYFRFDTALGRSYFYRDRSLLYNRIEVGFRV